MIFVMSFLEKLIHLLSVSEGERNENGISVFLDNHPLLSVSNMNEINPNIIGLVQAEDWWYHLYYLYHEYIASPGVRLC